MTILEYADDTILFLRRSNDLKVRPWRYLRIFTIILGIRINLHRSQLVGVGTDQEEAHRLASLLGCQVGTLPMKYLGLQLGGRKRDIQS